MKILVTGAAGFIGGHVARAYLAAGHEVVAVDDLSSGKRSNLDPAMRFYQFDIQDPAVGEVFERERPDVLNHHAAQMNVRRSVADPIFDARVNLVGFLNLMEHGRQHGLRRVVFASSGGTVYGEQEVFPAAENHRTEPLSPYGVAKLATERYLGFYSFVYGISYIALRYANVYGPRQNPHGEAGVIAIFAHQLLRGQPAVINGDGRQTRDYVYISDVVRANKLALESDFCGPVNIATGRETDVNTLFDILRQEINPAAQDQHGPAKPGEALRCALDPTRAREVLGWQPEVSLTDGLRETVAFVRSEVAPAKGAA